MVGLGLYLDVFGSESHVFVWVLRNFWRKIAKMSKEGKLGKLGLRRSVGCLSAAKPRAKMATPWVRCSVAVLRHSEVLRRGEGTVQKGKKILDFVSKASYLCTDSIRTLIIDQ